MTTDVDELQVNKDTGEISLPFERELTRREVVDLLNAAYHFKTVRDDAGKVYDALLRKATPQKPAGPIRDYADAHPDDTLYDGETGVSLSRKPHGTAANLDLMGLAAQHPDIVLKLAEVGLLKLDAAAWKAHSLNFAEADVARGYLIPGREDTALSVVKEEPK
jgi:hypothetical protein